MTFRGRSEKYYKIRINKTKGRERYGTFNRDSVRRAELRDSVYDPDIRRNTGKRVSFYWNPQQEKDWTSLKTSWEKKTGNIFRI